VSSEHTVHRHLANILRKLGLSPRAAAAAWAVWLFHEHLPAGGGKLALGMAAIAVAGLLLITLFAIIAREGLVRTAGSGGA